METKAQVSVVALTRSVFLRKSKAIQLSRAVLGSRKPGTHPKLPAVATHEALHKQKAGAKAEFSMAGGT